MEISDIWCPSSKYKADKNIMETAVQDSKFQGRKRWKLKIINQCRMYLQVFYISKMMDKAGKVSMKWLNGNKINKKHKLNFPTFQKPPEAAWTTWKEFIFQNFITGNREVDSVLVLSRISEHENCMRSNIPAPNSMSAAISKLPEEQKQIPLI